MLEKNIKNFHGLKKFRREGMAPGSTTKHIMDEWKQYNVREEAQDFIAHCLHPNADYRLKAQEAVDHSPWLADSGAGCSTAPLTHVGDRLLASQVKRRTRTKTRCGSSPAGPSASPTTQCGSPPPRSNARCAGASPRWGWSSTGRGSSTPTAQSKCCIRSWRGSTGIRTEAPVATALSCDDRQGITTVRSAIPDLLHLWCVSQIH